MFFQEVQELGVLWVVASLPMGGTQSVAVLGTKLSASKGGRSGPGSSDLPGLAGGSGAAAGAGAGPAPRAAPARPAQGQ